MKKKLVLVVIPLVFLCAVLIFVSSVCSGPTSVSIPTKTSTSISTPTFLPTLTDTPTSLPRPTNIRVPTSTPRSTNTMEITQESILLTGSGSSVVDVEKGSLGAVAHITGNAVGRHFAVINYGSGGKQYDLLVNTTEPYEGFRSLDFSDDEHTTRFEVKATGDWTIEILPLTMELLQDHVINSPGSYEGTGDDVFFVSGNCCDTATIKGNEASSYFGAFGWSEKGRELLVNTTDPYEGTVIMKRDTFAVEVRAVGSWLIEVTAP